MYMNHIKHNIVITDNAFEKASELSNKEKAILRIAVDGGGCSGFEYNYTMADNVEKDDILFEKNGAKIVIDQVSLSLLKDSTIDFAKELGSSKFVITNPNAKIKCGCGNSFSL